MENCPECKREVEEGMEEGFVCENCDKIWSFCPSCDTQAKFLWLCVSEKDVPDYEKMKERDKTPVIGKKYLENKNFCDEYADCGVHSDTVVISWECKACQEKYTSCAD
nr:hypothetical protein MarQu_358 [Marseillevirus sp.]